jgi:hypothetical protein
VLLLVTVPVPGLCECLFINGNTSENSVHSFRVQEGDVPLEVSGSPFLTGGIAGVHRTPHTLAAVGSVLFVLNSGSSRDPASVSAFAIGSDCRLSLSEVSGPLPGFATSLLLDRSSRFLYVIHFEADAVSMFRREGTELRPLGTASAVQDEPLDMIQHSERGIIYIAYRNKLGLGTFEMQEDGSLQFTGMTDSGLHWGLVAPAQPDRLYSFELASGRLNGQAVETTGSLSLLPGSPWPGLAGTNHVVFSARHQALYVVSENLRSVRYVSMSLRQPSVGIRD